MERKEKKQENSSDISIGNSVICSDIWHKYIWKLLFYLTAREIWDNFEISLSGIYAKYHTIQIILLFVYTTSRKGL